MTTIWSPFGILLRVDVYRQVLIVLGIDISGLIGVMVCCYCKLVMEDVMLVVVVRLVLEEHIPHFMSRALVLKS